MSKSKALGVSTFTWPAPGPRSATTALAAPRVSRSHSAKPVFGLRGGVPVLEVSEDAFSATGKRLKSMDAPAR